MSYQPDPSINPLLSDTRVASYLAGECSDKERAEIEAMAGAHSEWRDTLASAHETWDLAGRAIHLSRRELRVNPAESGALPRFELAIGNTTPRVYPSKISRPWIGYAFTALIAVAGAAGIYKYVQAHFDAAKRDHANVRTYATQSGQRATITLADGSTAILAPATTMRVSSRKVELNGEALFTVMANRGEPFTVSVNGTQTKVLGTTFSVRGYDNERVRVVVAEGKVAVNSAVLTVGDAAVVDKYGIQVQHDANVADAFAWSAGRLRFNETTFEEAIPQLARWYGIDIKAGSALLKRNITATLSVEENPAEVIRLIGIALDAKVNISGAKAVFTAK